MEAVYIERVNKAVDFIISNIDKKISLNSISEACGISKFHFHRIFQAFTGESAYETINRLRLEKAAEILTDHPSIPIRKVAAETGFPDSVVFSKAFKDNFSVSPTAWRSEGKTLPGTAGRIQVQDDFFDAGSLKPVSTETVMLEDFSIAYIRHSGAYSGDSSLFIYLYNKLTAWAASRDLLGPQQKNIVVYHDPVKITEESRSKISIGLSVPRDMETSRDIGKMNFNGGLYLICRFSLRDEDYRDAWNQVYRHWLPSYSLIPSEGFCFESYPADVKSEDRHSSIVDICIPVEKLK